MAKKSKAIALKKQKSKSSGIVKFLETIVILGTVAAIAVKFFKGKKK